MVVGQLPWPTRGGCAACMLLQRRVAGLGGRPPGQLLASAVPWEAPPPAHTSHPVHSPQAEQAPGGGDPLQPLHGVQQRGHVASRLAGRCCAALRGVAAGHGVTCIYSAHCLPLCRCTDCCCLRPAASPELRQCHRHTLQGYDWSQHAGATVADVGGSAGGILGALLGKYPGMRGILFDR